MDLCDNDQFYCWNSVSLQRAWHQNVCILLNVTRNQGTSYTLPPPTQVGQQPQQSFIPFPLSLSSLLNTNFHFVLNTPSIKSGCEVTGAWGALCGAGAKSQLKMNLLRVNKTDFSHLECHKQQQPLPPKKRKIWPAQNSYNEGRLLCRPSPKPFWLADAPV